MPMAAIRCYLDGSEDGNGATFGVGGFVGNAGEWEELQPEWLASLPSNVTCLHATDCFSGNKEFKGVPIRERVELLEKLTDVILAFDIRLICAAVDVRAYGKYATLGRKLDPFGQNKFGVCFGSAIQYACESIAPQNVKTDEACAFFIERDEFEATAKREFSVLRVAELIWFRHRIGTETYGDKRGNAAIPLLQVADFGAFLGVKYLSKCKPGAIDWRPYFYELRNAKKIFKCTRDNKRILKGMHETFKIVRPGLA